MADKIPSNLAPQHIRTIEYFKKQIQKKWKKIVTKLSRLDDPRVLASIRTHKHTHGYILYFANLHSFNTDFKFNHIFDYEQRNVLNSCTFTVCTFFFRSLLEGSFFYLFNSAQFFEVELWK